MQGLIAAKVVLDPVMVSTSGHRLMNMDAQKILVEKLLPLADVITPNIPEAEVLCGFAIQTKEDMLKAAKSIAEYYDGAILIKGGHFVCDASDLLYRKGESMWFETKRINNPNTHGTGCTLSSAIACNLAKGHTI